MLTIREQILKLIKTEIAKIKTTNGYYTNIGLHPIRGRYDIAPAELPAVAMLADQDNMVSHLGHEVHEMPITIAGFLYIKNSIPDYSDRAAHDAEAILGDIQTCLLAQRITLDFLAGSREPALGTVLTGNTSGATAILESISVSSGSWAGGDAAGTFSLRLPWLGYESETITNAGGETLATTTGTMTLIPPFSDLLNNIEYRRGGIDPLPDPGEDILKVSVSFSVTYATLAGNPYKQS